MSSINSIGMTALGKPHVFVRFSTMAFGGSKIQPSSGLRLRNTISPEMRRAGMTWIQWTERGWNMVELSKSFSFLAAS